MLSWLTKTFKKHRTANGFLQRGESNQTPEFEEFENTEPARTHVCRRFILAGICARNHMSVIGMSLNEEYGGRP